MAGGRISAAPVARRYAKAESGIDSAMRELTLPGRPADDSRLTRAEKRAAIAEVLALFVTFLVAFTGRSHFSDTIKDVLIAISVLIGGLGAAAGLRIAWRGLSAPEGRWARLGLGGGMAFFGLYTIVHVLS
jgi:hypothetical protein